MGQLDKDHEIEESIKSLGKKVRRLLEFSKVVAKKNRDLLEKHAILAEWAAALKSKNMEAGKKLGELISKYEKFD